MYPRIIPFHGIREIYVINTTNVWNANRAKKSTVKQKQNVFVSLPNHQKLSETKTFCFCFTAKSLKTE